MAFASLRAPHLALLVAGLLLASACGEDETPDDPAAATDDAAPTDDEPTDAVLPEIPLEEDPGLEHVHGLGINPADDLLYVATHFGLWRVDDDGEAERVGEHYLDLMGFTVVGPDRFLASGHPPFTDRLPTHLGLIETTDAGETWRAVSLLGEADFHALRAVHDRIYGWDTQSGALKVSDEGRDWDVRGEAPLLDVVVDPDDPERLLATTGLRPEELVVSRSDDGGHTWSELDTPTLARLAWEHDDRLFGIGPEGAVLHGEDAGEHWEQVGDVGGFPEALLDTGDALYVAADHRLALSTDDGETWRVLHDYG